MFEHVFLDFFVAAVEEGDAEFEGCHDHVGEDTVGGGDDLEKRCLLSSSSAGFEDQIKNLPK